jgi:hypothetical protein
MKTHSSLRVLAALALLSFGACDVGRSPTAVEAPAAPRLNAAPTGLVTSHSNGTEVLTWNAASGATGYEYRYVDEYTYDDYNAGTSIYTTTSAWTAVSGTSVDTGRTWTGNMQCFWGASSSAVWYTDYYWEVRAVYSNGPGQVAWTRANVATC